MTMNVGIRHSIGIAGPAQWNPTSAKIGQIWGPRHLLPVERGRTITLLGDYCDGDGNGARRQAGVRVAGLVAKSSLQQMLARLGRQVSMQDELAGIHAELFPRSKLRGILSACREVDCGDVETLHLDHYEPRRDQGLVRWRMGVDVQTIGHAEV